MQFNNFEGQTITYAVSKRDLMDGSNHDGKGAGRGGFGGPLFYNGEEGNAFTRLVGLSVAGAIGGAVGVVGLIATGVKF